MCQFNFIIVQHSGAAADYLESLGYYCFCSLQHGYDAYSWGRTECCNCGSMVGSLEYRLKNEGKYPNSLNSGDYKRAIQKEIKILNQMIELQEEDNFSKKVNEFTFKLEAVHNKLEEYCTSKGQVGFGPWMVDLGEEGAELWEKFEKFFEEGENTIINYARIYTKIQLKERINERISCNYNMHEYRYYRRIFSRLLKLEPCIYFTHVWSQPGELNLVNTLTLDQLRIGDLALLAQDDVIKICRKDTVAL